MTIHLGDLRYGAVIEYESAGGHSTRLAYVNAFGLSHFKSGAPTLALDESESITRVFVPVPDGVSVEDAERALASLVRESGACA